MFKLLKKLLKIEECEHEWDISIERWGYGVYQNFICKKCLKHKKMRLN